MSDDPYPVTIFRARYNGTYEGGKWVAVNERPGSRIMNSALGDDVGCTNWFSMYEEFKPIGRGRTPAKAYEDLRRKIREAADGL